jgi:antitoxin component of RelBE/YafQ-DinJ toxin-antitoxin module
MQGETMPQRTKGRSEGVQIRLDPDLKHEARLYLTMANMTWQDLLEPCVRKFVETSRMQTPRQPLKVSREPT